jgi:hypothetical protein
MTDLPSSLGIEAVELLAEGGRSVTVRVTGRWRRRRPELRGQAMLVVEAAGGRQRFLAMPEPPSLTGAAPGTWRMSFAVPATLASELPGRTFLQLGGVMVPLPVGDAPSTGEAAEPPGAELLEERRVRSFELAAESARRRAAELAGQVERLERELDETQARSERLGEEIAERERQLRSAEQQAHAERALRAEIEEELSRQSRVAQHDLRVLHERVADLERELARMRRAVDEAEHLAAAAEAARLEVERRLTERAPPAPTAMSPPPAWASERPPPASAPEPAPALEPPLLAPAPEPPPAPEPFRAFDLARAELSARELEVYRSARGASAPAAPPRPAERAGDRAALRHEAVMVERRWTHAGGDSGRLATLERELAATREELEDQRRLSARAYEAIELVRAELRQLSATSQAAAPPQPNPPLPPRSAAAPAGPVQAEQLSAALARLRDRTPATPSEEATGAVPAEPRQADSPPAAFSPVEPPAPGRPTKPWLIKAFRALASQDPSAAGRLLLALVPAQRAADPHPVAYDLILGDLVCAHVTVESVAVHVELDATARPASEVDFQLVGNLASIARLMAAGPVRRRLSRLTPRRRLARLRGDRRRLAALDHLVRATLTVQQLHAAGVRLDPLLAFMVAGLMIEPAWTAEERFTIGHREVGSPAPDAYLHVRDGRPPLASDEAPHGPVATTLVCPGEELFAVLGGASGAAEVVGGQRPLRLVRQWLERAQCG